MPRSFVINSKDDLLKNIWKIRSQKVVAKPFFGSGGFGIIITEKNKLKNSKLTFPFLLQEFVKSEKGIPGFSKKKGVADLRIVFMNHKPTYALSPNRQKRILVYEFPPRSDPCSGSSQIHPPIRKKNNRKSCSKIVDFSPSPLFS